MSQPRVLFVAQYILVEGAIHSGKKAQCILVEGAMHSGKKARCILVKSDDFENRTPFYIFFLNHVYVAARSLRSLRSNKTLIYPYATYLTPLIVRWFREKIVTDWKKAPNLAHKLCTIWKTNLVWVPLDPIIRGGVTGDSFCDNLC